MGILDFFNNDEKIKSNRTNDIFNDMPSPVQTPKQNGPVCVITPKSYDDVSKIIDIVKQGKTAIVHLTDLKPETALRILDMLSGAVYALSGGIYEMEKNVFLLSPTGVEF